MADNPLEQPGWWRKHRGIVWPLLLAAVVIGLLIWLHDETSA